MKLKRILSLILALMIASSFTVNVFAEGNTQKVTTTKDAPQYTFEMPKDATVESGATKTDIGAFKISVGNDWFFDEKILVSWGSGGEFTPVSSEINTTIPYSLNKFYEEGSCASEDYEFSEYELSHEQELFMIIDKADWDKARPGNYETTITYTITVHK